MVGESNQKASGEIRYGVNDEKKPQSSTTLEIVKKLSISTYKNLRDRRR